MLLIVSIIITAELYSTFKYHMKIGETTRCCSFFLKTHVKISSKISIIEFNIQIKWCIIVTPSREAEKDYQGYFNSPPHKKNHIATTMINTVLFKISTHIFTRRMTATCTNTTVSNIISTHILTKRMTVSVLPSGFVCSFQLTSSRRGWQRYAAWSDVQKYFNSHPHEEDDFCTVGNRWAEKDFNSHPHEEDDFIAFTFNCSALIFQLTSSRRGWPFHFRWYCWLFYISTHILTKRMTVLELCYGEPICISTHILTKRMTLARLFGRICR